VAQRLVEVEDGMMVLSVLHEPFRDLSAAKALDSSQVVEMIAGVM
jgi:hypothetical protein